MNYKSICLPVSEASAAGEARRVAMGLAEDLKFHSVKVGEVGIIVTELANNLWRHAGEGEIVFRTLSAPGRLPSARHIMGLEILSIDKGPGMPDVERCLRDGFSSGGSAGIGLGAISRLSSFSEIYTRPRQGTVSISQIWATPLPKTFFSAAEIGAVCLQIKGQQVCGDAWAEKTTEAGQQLLLVDGLGHGPGAAQASDTAVEVFLEKNLPAKEMIEALHLALKTSVGAVVGLVEITPRGRTFSFIGLGNIAGRVSNGEERKSLLSHNGTVGVALHSVRQENYPWRNNSLLVMHTDGISGKWDLENYPGLSSRHPSVIAGVIYRDFRRDRDDASVIVMREPSD
ncbi:MAG: putative anti-sigma regulatory factor, serine/threonine protein kinase [Verrucomicrobiales bacterium]|nr:putative anti-sigma regulatory factor, serine/threonine protein kinase [Verrucomicrobiales bacterium]